MQQLCEDKKGKNLRLDHRDVPKKASGLRQGQGFYSSGKNTSLLVRRKASTLTLFYLEEGMH